MLWRPLGETHSSPTSGAVVRDGSGFFSDNGQHIVRTRRRSHAGGRTRPEGRSQQALVVRQVVRDERGSGTVRFPDESDPIFDDFLGDPRIVALHLEHCLLEQFRFGEVLYKHYRCHWIHRGYASPLLGPSDMDDRDGRRDLLERVRYWNVSRIRADGALVPHLLHPDAVGYLRRRDFHVRGSIRSRTPGACRSRRRN
jgi:hypothetical protein